ncbi:MAG: class I SAM-dependent methyltransferase [Betaproteobacteria bacterium]|nr:class I SAM-dependent methyltransferase [Betaproteobacteria bacterium]
MTKAGGAGTHGPALPSEWVLRGLHWLPTGARTLDFASGTGRHARAADQRGLRVTASDRDAAALEQIGGTVRCMCADLEAGLWPFEPASFDAVIVTNYLYRPRFSELCGLLSPGGLLIYETFALGNERYGRPSNPDFLLQPGELFDRCREAGLAVLAFEDGVILTGRQARVQRIFAVRPPVNLEGFAIE